MAVAFGCRLRAAGAPAADEAMPLTRPNKNSSRQPCSRTNGGRQDDETAAGRRLRARPHGFRPKRITQGCPQGLVHQRATEKAFRVRGMTARDKDFCCHQDTVTALLSSGCRGCVGGWHPVTERETGGGGQRETERERERPRQGDMHRQWRDQRTRSATPFPPATRLMRLRVPV